MFVSQNKNINPYYVSNLSSNGLVLLKYLGILFMIVDHIGYYLVSMNSAYYQSLRIIGRLSFPMFVIGAIYGHSKTSNVMRYIIRLLIMGILAYMITGIINIGFTLSLIVCLCELDERYRNKNISRIIYFFGILSIFIMSVFVDYSIYGMIGAFCLIRFMNEINYKKSIIWFCVSFIAFASPLFFPIYAPYQSFASISILLFLYISKKELSIKKGNKWMFYIFYPAHLFILEMIRFLI